MTEPAPYCILPNRNDSEPCEGPADAVLIRGPFMSRARDAMTEPIPACVRHGGHLFGVLHKGRVLAALDEGRITPGPGGDEQAVFDALARVLAAEPTAEPGRCPASAIPTPDSIDCDGRHDAVVVRARFSARVVHGLDGDVPGCVHHGARLLVVSNGGSVRPGPGGTEPDAADVRRRAEAAWAALAAPADPARQEEDTYDPGAASANFRAPQVRRLAQARWRMTTGGTYTQWLQLGKDDPGNQIREAREWMRAAVAAGILPPPA